MKCNADMRAATVNNCCCVSTKLTLTPPPLVFIDVNDLLLSPDATTATHTHNTH